VGQRGKRGVKIQKAVVDPERPASENLVGALINWKQYYTNSNKSVEIFLLSVITANRIVGGLIACTYAFALICQIEMT
jgi:hypothetical protein